MRIGIITMHKVLNCGSALQAYALQRKLREMGYDSEIIDYKYLDKSASTPSMKARVTSFLREALFGFPAARMKRKFKAFYWRNLVLSKKAYDKESILKNPPRYDLYLAGSDQIWNPRFIGDDVNFLLAFAAPDARRISYASSIAAGTIEGRLKEIYSRHLSRFLAISVRESSGVGIIRELTGKEATVCCDPTLLLERDAWDSLAAQSRYRINEKYILVYALSYMFDPFPGIYGIVDSVQKTLGMKVVFLQGRAKDFFRKDSKLIKSAGPADFAYLFKHAAFVITTSFHGACFALINDKPLIGVVDSRSAADSRIQSLLESVSAADSIYDYRDTPDLETSALFNLKGNRDALDNLAQGSAKYLKDNLQ
ncbi:MAG: polysaccharide pyruvyl transferase family protein [Bacteroidales bacterium]|nr:polysaccharide pyruvyl transferase family protein [Bacteroidales bacterium]